MNRIPDFRVLLGATRAPATFPFLFCFKSLEVDVPGATLAGRGSLVGARDRFRV